MEEILSSLLDVAIEAHGGLKLWREIEEVELKLSLTGVLFQSNGHWSSLPMQSFISEIAYGQHSWMSCV